MYITMNRPRGAPFDVFATDGQSELLPQKAVNSLKNLTWESVVIKNYCLAVNQQADLILEDIPELSTVQIDSRITANLWLNEISIAVNEVYTTVDYFCGAYESPTKN